MEVTLELVGAKWKVFVLWQLAQNGVMRFNALSRIHPDLTSKMLSQQLKELERDELVVRRSYNQVPPKVEYSLSTWGQSLVPVLEQMCQWGERYLEKHEQTAATPCARAAAGQ